MEYQKSDIVDIIIDSYTNACSNDSFCDSNDKEISADSKKLAKTLGM